eukprot:16429204-Heterocapsa_arctica.AAC.1
MLSSSTDLSSQGPLPSKGRVQQGPRMMKQPKRRTTRMTGSQREMTPWRSRKPKSRPWSTCRRPSAPLTSPRSSSSKSPRRPPRELPKDEEQVGTIGQEDKIEVPSLW